MRISALTPTADRPAAFALAERWMARQTLQPDEWIVADGGQVPAPCTMGQVHIHAPRPPGAENFAHNLLRGIDAARGEIVVFVEDDDLYLPNHIETLAAALQANPHALLAGGDRQRYYNVALRRWREFANVGASLCQTAMRRDAFPQLVTIIKGCITKHTYGIDTNLWRSVPREQWALTATMTCLGIKGLPGQAGLGIGHRPQGSMWNNDPELAQLRAWVGADAEVYAGFHA